ncbi:cytochrome P450 family protein, partial [Jatrophihabitans sp.]|uniref:cytochrome P450 family protein n=1 Tax=Jatrophihabitans sp. TaxID=1932789 RepID=UPI002F2141B2
EVRALVNDPRVSKDGRRMNELFARHSGLEFEPDTDEAAGVGFDDDLAAHMLNSDPPRHTRLRALVSKAFTPQRVAKLRPRIEQVVEQLLDTFESRSEVELVSEFAVRLPITIICDLCGMHEDDRENFRQWSLKLVGAGQDPEEVAAASKKMVDYAHSLIDSKRAAPGDDLISELVQVTDGTDRLTQGELVAMIFVLAVAGHITTIYSIGNAAANLLRHPEELARLRADLSLMPAAVDELLRFDGPSAVGTFRFTREAIPVGDKVIPAGEILALSWHSANRDSSHFPDADRLDLTRRPVGPMSFGHGLHYCIGVPLAKMQIEIALSRLITRYPHLRLAVDPEELRWDHSALLRGLLALPVLVSPPC